MGRSRREEAHFVLGCEETPEKLKAEWPAILRWAIDGCLEWQRIGLAPPKIVTEATQAYFSDQDFTELKLALPECLIQFDGF